MLIALIAFWRDRGKLINNFHDFTLTHLRTIRSLLDPYPRYPRDAGGHSRRMTRDEDVEGSLPGPASSDVRKKTVSYFRTFFLLSHVRVCVYISVFLDRAKKGTRNLGYSWRENHRGWRRDRARSPESVGWKRSRGERQPNDDCRGIVYQGR